MHKMWSFGEMMSKPSSGDAVSQLSFASLPVKHKPLRQLAGKPTSEDEGFPANCRNIRISVNNAPENAATTDIPIST